MKDGNTLGGILAFLWIFGPLLLAGLTALFAWLKKRKVKKQIKALASNQLVLSPKEFFKLRNAKGKGKGHYSAKYNFAGVYILHNETKDLYYVGQAQKILDRVNNHFTGKGNGDVYADYKYGDVFTIQMISLLESDCDTLNELERETIDAYDAVKKGYNKKRGNKNP